MERGERPVWESRARLIAVGVLAVLFLVLLVLQGDWSFAIAAVWLIAAAAVSVTTWAIWRSRVQRRAYEDQLTQWAAERAIQADRLRIARDLHDLASHGLGLMTVRAATASLADDDQDGERRQALRDIERIGRQATAELRRMLVVLRSDDDPAPLRPADSLRDLPGIIDTAQRAGLEVTVDHGDLGPVSAGVQLCVCATIREALANTLRYAGPTIATVTVRRVHDFIRVDVRDQGPIPGWRPHPGTGNGLRQLRERLAVYAGTLTAGPDVAGYRLLAEIPDQPTNPADR